MDNVIPLRPEEAAREGVVTEKAPPRRRGKLTPGRHPWPGVSGGWIYVARDGGYSYYAKRKVGGAEYGPVMLGHDPEIAMKAYREWWPNPAGWKPEGHLPEAPVHLTEELVQAYATWCAKPRPGTKRKRNRDPSWIRQKVNRLAWWAEKLGGKNLRNDGSPGCVTKDVLEAALADGVDYRGRLANIRAFYTFLRTASVNDLPASKRILIQHDPAKDIPLPGAEAAQAVKGSKVEWTKEDSDKVIAWLEAYESPGRGGKPATPQVRAPDSQSLFTTKEAAAHLGLTVGSVQTYVQSGLLQHEGGGHGSALVFRRKHLDRFERARDARARTRKTKDTPRRVALALIVLGGTASHAREVARFSKNGVVTELEPEHRRQNGAAKKIVFEHKSGDEHAQAVSARVAEAAEELLRIGGVPYTAIFTWTKKAVEATGAAKFTPGRFRHRGATYAVNQGVTVKEVGEGIGHTNEKTTGIYVLKAAPPKLPTWY